MYGLSVVAHHVNTMLNTPTGQSAIYAALAKETTLRGAFDELGVWDDLERRTWLTDGGDFDLQREGAFKELDRICTEADTEHPEWVGRLFDMGKMTIQIAKIRLLRPRLWYTPGNYDVGSPHDALTKDNNLRVVLDVSTPSYG